MHVATHRFWRAAFARMRFVRKDFWEGYLDIVIVISISVWFDEQWASGLLTMADDVDDGESRKKNKVCVLVCSVSFE